MLVLKKLVTEVKGTCHGAVPLKSGDKAPVYEMHKRRYNCHAPHKVNGRTQYGCEHARRRRFLACIDRSGRQDKGICHGAMPEVARKEQDAVRS